MRFRSRLSLATTFLSLGVCAAVATVATPGHAQSSSTQRPMADVLLLVDTSGSMERMADNSLPSANNGVPVGGLQNACQAGVESNPNRWGMLLQALTGNMQPYFSCAAQDRSSGGAGAAFRNEYKIGNVVPYDTDYFLPYHRPLTGSASNLTTCGLGPARLPGAAAGNGVGPSALGYATPAGRGGDVRDFPDDALQSAKWTYMQGQYGANTALASPLGTNACIFDQAPDGQLDAARDYVRFALMTFDNSESNAVGVSTWPPSGNVLAPVAGTTIPFLGQWSYRRDTSNPLFNAATGGSAEGLPFGCAPPNQQFEVGARHWGAPPWEGRMVPFPAPDASLFDIQRTNEHIQQVLLTTRPYGATPIDGMMDDARDYYWYNAIGPKNDPYVATANCREQFIILLTDGAPNLDMRPSCVGGICPFPNDAASIAASLYADTSRRVTTFVIGFSVNGTSPTGNGFPPPYDVGGLNNCKSWYAGVSAPGAPNPQAMATACSAAVGAGYAGEGTTAQACCMLNKIAFEGSGGASATTPVGPFFAESQADIVLSFGKILATVTKAVSTRTVPAFTPSVYSASGFGAGAITAQYQGSFIPNAQKPWSGEISRERSICGTSTGPLKAEPVTASVSAGDSQAVNLATQGAANRLFITFVPTKYTVSPAVGTPPSTEVIDGAGTVRPYYPNAVDLPEPVADGIPTRGGAERAALDWGLKDTTDFRLALDIDRTTCKQGRAVGTGPSGTVQIPALNTDSGEACTRVVLGFATAHAGVMNETGTIPGGGPGTYNFNVRCRGATNSPASGVCSITGATCNVADADPCPGLAGQVCVPDCSPLGAIFRANLTVNGPPDGLLRDAGYRAFQGRRSRRRPVLYAATTDGILHAFKAVEQASDGYHELWSFLPPAVLPRLASNYPAGNQILLDGTPVVRDTVWYRSPGDLDSGGSLTPGAKWHTTLVAGLGAEGGGYYALNVTDPDCNAPLSMNRNECISANTNPPYGSSGYDRANPPANRDEAGRSGYEPEGVAKAGPHFLWQLTDLPKASGTDPAKVVRRTKDGQEMVSLFGRQTGTPAITTVQIQLGGADRQIGVAILPGGLDGPPVRDEYCDRFSLAPGDVAFDTAFAPRSRVRRWATNCTGANSAVPGRGVTIVRLDNGQILRHFGRVGDVPAAITAAGVVNASTFDSPMVGTPVVYPQTLGAIAQKIFIGDADGTLWRIDVSNRDPSLWKAQLFADLVVPNSGDWQQSQPIQVAPALSLEPGGALVINAATGDQENVLYRTGDKNYVWSIMEARPVDTTPPKAVVKWYETLDNGERVTGPMTVFDRALYFASFAPRNPGTGSSGQCENAGVARLWGLNYFVADGTGPAAGGLPMWCTNVAANGVCSTASPLTKNETVTGALAGFLIPGVTLRPTQACSLINDVNTGEGTGNTGFQSLAPSEFHLSYGVGKAAPPAAGLPPRAMTASRQRPLPRIATTVNAWALVVD